VDATLDMVPDVDGAGLAAVVGLLRVEQVGSSGR
jgi:hypothetical protein